MSSEKEKDRVEILEIYRKPTLIAVQVRFNYPDGQVKETQINFLPHPNLTDEDIERDIRTAYRQFAPQPVDPATGKEREHPAVEKFRDKFVGKGKKKIEV